MSTSNEILGAIYRKDFTALESLLGNVDVNAYDKHGRTILMYAVLDDSADPHLVSYLIAKGANPELPDTVQKWTPLHFAARDQKAHIVKLLLDTGIQVDAVDVFGNTPLWRNVMQPDPDPEIVSMLLLHGADPNKKNKHGISPIDTAQGRDDILRMLE